MKECGCGEEGCKRLICEGCGGHVDPKVCWCGHWIGAHRLDHVFVPMGCTCYFVKKEKTKEANAYLVDALRSSLDAFNDIQEDGQPHGVSVGWLIEHVEAALEKAKREGKE